MRRSFSRRKLDYHNAKRYISRNFRDTESNEIVRMIIGSPKVDETGSCPPSAFIKFVKKEKPLCDPLEEELFEIE